MRSPFKFQRYGQSGLEVSDLFAKTAQHIDDIAVIRSMQAEVPNHEPSLLLLNCGDSRQVRPSMGSWVTYGLGTENRNLPGYVVLNNDWVPNGGLENFGSSFLPASHQATLFRAKGVPVDNIAPQDAAAVRQALGGLKPPFSRLFLRFG